MRRLAFLLLLGYAMAADAAEWTLVYAGPEGNQYYYDASKLAVAGNEITYWKKVLFKSPQSYKGMQAVSALYRERIHCTEHTIKPLSHIIHASAGAMIEQVSSEGEATPIIPESIGDLFEAALCPQVRNKRDEVPPRTPDKVERKMEVPLPSPPPAFTDQDMLPGSL